MLSSVETEYVVKRGNLFYTEPLKALSNMVLEPQGRKSYKVPQKSHSKKCKFNITTSYKFGLFNVMALR